MKAKNNNTSPQKVSKVKEKRKSNLQIKKKKSKEKGVVITQKLEPVQIENKKIYLSYNTRLLIWISIIVFLSIIGSLFIYNSFQFKETKNINYREKGNINYEVELKENNFYDNRVMNENMAYVASLIDSIKIKYNYQVIADKTVNFAFDYDIIARLVIEDSNSSTKFYDKEYIISPKESVEKRLDHYTINKNVTIKYDEYNSIANKFKSNYSLSTNSYLEVYLNVYKNCKEINFKDPSSKLLLKIPLSQKAINITMEADEISDTGIETILLHDFTIKNKILFVLGTIILLLATVSIVWFVIYINKFRIHKNPYDKYLSKILKEYDRFIVIVKRAPILDNYNKTSIASFTELLDIRDNINKPIMYYEITPHQKCQFYIVDGIDIYIYVLKAIDLKENK